MALTAEQQALLEALQAKAAEKEPRTDTGLKGVLHTLIDAASGAVAHRSAEGWEAVHDAAEHYDDEPAPAEGNGGQAANGQAAE